MARRRGEAHARRQIRIEKEERRNQPEPRQHAAGKINRGKPRPDDVAHAHQCRQRGWSCVGNPAAMRHRSRFIVANHGIRKLPEAADRFFE